MKVMMVPNALNLASSESGIHTVVCKYLQHAPAAGIEFVGPQTDSFDVLAVHAGMSKEHPIAGPFVAHLHELYFTADYSADLGEYQANRDAIDAIRYATTVTVPSDWVAESLRRDMHLQPTVLGHGIDWQEWQHGEPNDGYVLWNKHRATAGYDPAPVGELAKRFPQQRFLTTFAPKTPTPNMRAAGVLTHDQMHKIMQRAGVYLATTKETGGIGILESTAAGIPVLGFRHGAILDMVQHGVNGYLAKPGDYDDLANGLEYCLKHRDMLGANGRELAKQFTWQRVMEQLHGIYDATIQHFHQPPRVSVIIPCYNYSRTLERAVRSVLAQTHQPWEIIIVDNNSTDNTAQVAHNLAQQYRTVRYDNCEEQGVAHARNWGVEQAVGKYIVCLDADDEIKPSFIEVCLQALLADPSLGLAYTKMERVWQDGQRRVFEWPVEYNFDSFLNKHNAVPTCCMFRRDLWQRLGGYRQRYAPRGAGAEDAEFWMRMGALGYRGKLASKEPLFSYYMGGSVSGAIGYTEPDWLAGKPYVTDGQHPLASMATPAKPSHPVRQYDEPVVSVVIPCELNHAQYLTDALDSLEAQTFRQWEAIVVCDGFSMPVDLLTAFPFVRAVQTDNVGPEAARNAGAAIARGAFLLFLDADDWQRPQAIQRLLQALQQEQAIIDSDYARHTHSLNRKITAYSLVNQTTLLQPAAAERMWVKTTEPGVWACLETQRKTEPIQNLVHDNLDFAKIEVSKNMKIKAYSLYDHAAALRPASEGRAWVKQNEAIAADLGLHMASDSGWELLCPYAFEATWNGGSAAEDIAIRIAAPDGDAPAFVQSQLGAGLLTFYPGYQFKTEEEQALWVRSPINIPKDGLYPLEQIVDTSLLPCTINVTWKFTRPNHTIRFAAGEPFGTILPYPKSAQENMTLDVVQPDADADLDAYERAFQQMADSAAVQRVFQRLGTPPVLGIVFSRDRAMQLDATLRSFHLHCQDADAITLHVIYKTTHQRHAKQYAQLAEAYAAAGTVHFVEETDFRQDVVRLLVSHGAKGQAGYILFLVDDNIFVRDFHLGQVCEALAHHPAAVGFSLRLGENTTYMYIGAKAQIVPPLTRIGENMRLFDWTTAQGDFDYPLEVSSSMFRIDELASLLQDSSFTNPNTLEFEMSKNLTMFKQQTPHLLCYARSAAFCAPVNKVQTTFGNRAGTRTEYSAAHLAEMFDQGYRIRVDAYAGFVPCGCHQEVELIFEQRLAATPAEII